MRTFVIFILTLSSAVTLRAQSLDAFKQRLSTPSTSMTSSVSSRVVVTEHGNAAKSISSLTNNSQRARVRGHRVCIFLDNGQNARAGAVAAKTLFEESYPGIKVYMVYTTPYFRVTVGNCLTSEEAIMLKSRVSATFPKAFPKSEELSISDFLN